MALENFVRNIDRRTFLQIISFTGIASLIYPRKLISSLVPTALSRVVIVEDNTATNGAFINKNTIQVMMNSGIKALAQQNDIGEAWKTLLPNINSSSNIAIKVNCMNSSLPTHPEVTNAVVTGLKQMIVGGTSFPENNIIIFDRRNYELSSRGYTLNTSSTGLRCFGTDSTGVGYSNQSFDVYGVSQRLSRIITEMTDYLINISVLKSHSAVSGVTLCLKNHYGSCESPGAMHSNYADPYIPALNALTPINTKQKVNICDALFGIRSGDPTSAPPQFAANKIIMSQDIVAADYWGREILEVNGCTTTGRARHIDTAATNYSLGTNDPSKMEVVTITNPTVPVELALFEATIVNQNVHLTWTTKTETNNYGFEIERSMGSDWNTISFIEGNGTTNKPSSYEFVDKLSGVGALVSNIRYRLKQIDTDGSFEYSQILTVQLNQPISYQLEQNYPNPFNNQTQIPFSISKPVEVKLTIFDYAGRHVRRLVNKTLGSGRHQVRWDGFNDSGKAVASGIYVCQLKAGRFQKAIIMQLVK